MKKTKDRETDWRGETETCNPDASGESIWVTGWLTYPHVQIKDY
jgi:hypothetical protein